MKNLNKYSIDAMDELSRILSNEITKGVDKSILEGLMKLGVNYIRKRKLDNLYKKSN